MLASAVPQICMQLFAFPWMVGKWGYRRVFIVCTLCFAIAVVSMPYISLLAKNVVRDGFLAIASGNTTLSQLELNGPRDDVMSSNVLSIINNTTIISNSTATDHIQLQSKVWVALVTIFTVQQVIFCTVSLFTMSFFFTLHFLYINDIVVSSYLSMSSVQQYWRSLLLWR